MALTTDDIEKLARGEGVLNRGGTTKELRLTRRAMAAFEQAKRDGFLVTTETGEAGSRLEWIWGLWCEHSRSPARPMIRFHVGRVRARLVMDLICCERLANSPEFLDAAQAREIDDVFRRHGVRSQNSGGDTFTYATLRADKVSAVGQELLGIVDRRHQSVT